MQELPRTGKRSTHDAAERFDTLRAVLRPRDAAGLRRRTCRPRWLGRRRVLRRQLRGRPSPTRPVRGHRRHGVLTAPCGPSTRRHRGLGRRSRPSPAPAAWTGSTPPSNNIRATNVTALVGPTGRPRSTSSTRRPAYLDKAKTVVRLGILMSCARPPASTQNDRGDDGSVNDDPVDVQLGRHGRHRHRPVPRNRRPGLSEAMPSRTPTAHWRTGQQSTRLHDQPAIFNAFYFEDLLDLDDRPPRPRLPRGAMSGYADSQVQRQPGLRHRPFPLPALRRRRLRRHRPRPRRLTSPPWCRSSPLSPHPPLHDHRHRTLTTAATTAHPDKSGRSHHAQAPLTRPSWWDSDIARDILRERVVATTVGSADLRVQLSCEPLLRHDGVPADCCSPSGVRRAPSTRGATDAPQPRRPGHHRWRPPVRMRNPGRPRDGHPAPGPGGGITHPPADRTPRTAKKAPELDFEADTAAPLDPAPGAALPSGHRLHRPAGHRLAECRAYLDSLLELCRDTDDWPDDARVPLGRRGLHSFQNWPANRPRDARSPNFLDRVREGRVELTAMPVQPPHRDLLHRRTARTAPPGHGVA